MVPKFREVRLATNRFHDHQKQKLTHHFFTLNLSLGNAGVVISFFDKGNFVFPSKYS